MKETVILHIQMLNCRYVDDRPDLIDFVTRKCLQTQNPNIELVCLNSQRTREEYSNYEKLFSS